jgi:hypothetical protein
MFVNGEQRGAIKLGLAAAVVFGVGMAPFYLADPAAFTYAIVSFRPRVQIGGNTIWAIFTTGDWPGVVTRVAHRLDVYAIAAFAIAAAVLAGVKLRLSGYGDHAWAVLAMGALAIPMWTKLDWPYYFFAPCFLLLVWEFTTWHAHLAVQWRWPLIGIGTLVVGATLAPVTGLRSTGAPDRVLLGLTSFATFAGIAWLTWQRLVATAMPMGPNATQGQA